MPVSVIRSSPFDPANAALKRAAICLAVVLAILAAPQEMIVTRRYFVVQDAQAGVGMLALWLVAMRFGRHWRLPATPPSASGVIAAAVALALFLWWGTYAVMGDFPLTRDELMVAFDGAVYGSGRLSMPLAAQWRDFVPALVPDFLLDVPGHAALVSSYMPVNAATRAAFGRIADPALLDPLLAGIGLILLQRVARRLFADLPGAQWVVVGGYVLSAQILVNAMTSYAMTAHLVLNLAWLLLFLRDRWWSHALAMLVGAIAVGIHQVVFHPFFAAPFVVLLLIRRRRALSALYAGVYAAALLFWLEWPQIVVAAAGLTASSGGSTGGAGSFLATRVVPLLLDRDPRTIGLMIYNLLRSVGWNAAYVVPFMILATPALRRRDGVALALFAGLMLTIGAMAFLLPYQGHGWGYRYLHGVLGNILLLAGYGYCELARSDRPRADGLAATLAIGTVPIIAWLLVTTHLFVQPYARLATLIERQSTDFAIIDTEEPRSAVDQVNNRPDLSNRPLTFASDRMTPVLLIRLCDRGTVTLIHHGFFHAAGFALDLPEKSPRFDRRVATLIGRECVRPVRR
ncbi:hypothetical protein ACT009_00230 [Sphingomonas sp. Tas61C01]|uniref:hypothetical protein n=1 Tax=Sphingomonas sp. Tas61C01 TaxID=3458297 RepID=UPI00403E7DB3